MCAILENEQPFLSSNIPEFFRFNDLEFEKETYLMCLMLAIDTCTYAVGITESLYMCINLKFMSFVFFSKYSTL